jgi:hypothetical protein
MLTEVSHLTSAFEELGQFDEREMAEVAKCLKSDKYVHYNNSEIVCGRRVLQVAILEKQLSAVTPELMPGTSPNFNHRYI